MTKICRTEELLVTIIQIWVFLARSKVFRLHANLHKSSGAVKATTTMDRVIVAYYLKLRAHVSRVTLLVCFVESQQKIVIHAFSKC